MLRIGNSHKLQFIYSLIKDDMENRLANLKLNENVNEDHLKDKQQEIEQECVSDICII